MYIRAEHCLWGIARQKEGRWPCPSQTEEHDPGVKRACCHLCVSGVQGLVRNMAVWFPEAERDQQGPHAKHLEVRLLNLPLR